MEDYINDVNDDFRKCQNIENIMMAMFVAIIVISIINVQYDNNYVSYFLIFLNIGYLLISFINDIYFKNIAESERRKTNISNAFNVNLTSKKTNKFYNNNFSPSLKKLGINVFESTLYTKDTLLKMIAKTGFETFIILIMWIFIINNIEDINIFQIVTQFLFSAEILLGFIKTIYYYSETNKIYNNLYYHFVTKKYDESTDLPVVIQSILDYECLKSYCHISLSEAIFKKNKNKLENEWNNILKEIK